MSCDGKYGVITEQPVGTVTLWKATKFEHTSSIDEHADAIKSITSVGLVVVQKSKLINLPIQRHDVVHSLYCVEILNAYQLAGRCRNCNDAIHPAEARNNAELGQMFVQRMRKRGQLNLDPVDHEPVKKRQSGQID